MTRDKKGKPIPKRKYKSARAETRNWLIKKTAEAYATITDAIDNEERFIKLAREKVNQLDNKREALEKTLSNYVSDAKPRRTILVENGKVLCIEKHLHDDYKDGFYISVDINTAEKF